MPRRPTLHTIGYQQRSLAEFLALLLDAGIGVLLDVRETAWSHKPGFSKTALAAACAKKGIEYVHAREAGNPKALRRKARTHADCLARFSDHLDDQPELERGFDRLVSQLLEREKAVALMCYERHPEDCHRGILAERWQERRRGRIEHLEPEGCKRLVAV